MCSQVGYETINNSEDKILKQDMPPALNRVEEASVLLLQASQMLRQDPYSAPARKKLIEGSRGTLNVYVFYPEVRSTPRPGTCTYLSVLTYIKKSQNCEPVRSFVML